MPASSASTPMPVRRRAEEHRVDDGRAAVCVAELPRAAARYESAGSSPTYARRIASSCSARTSVSAVRCASSSAPNGTNVASRRPASRTVPIGTTPGDSRRAIASTTRLGIGAGPVDLVDEDQRRDVEPLEGAEQERRLGLDALDRRDDEDRAVEHAEDALDLGDEVGVAGRVDEVDREVADEERGDRGPDRDAAFALEVERVGLGGAGVDAADVVDGAGGEEESLGEGGLTGVDVGEDSEIERAHGTSCRARRCVTFWLDMGAPISLLSRGFRRGCVAPTVARPSTGRAWDRRRATVTGAGDADHGRGARQPRSPRPTRRMTTHRSRTAIRRNGAGDRVCLPAAGRRPARPRSPRW